MFLTTNVRFWQIACCLLDLKVISIGKTLLDVDVLAVLRLLLYIQEIGSPTTKAVDENKNVRDGFGDENEGFKDRGRRRPEDPCFRIIYRKELTHLVSLLNKFLYDGFAFYIPPMVTNVFSHYIKGNHIL